MIGGSGPGGGSIIDSSTIMDGSSSQIDKTQLPPI